MAASYSSLGGENQQANLAYEVFSISLDHDTSVDLTPAQIKSIHNVTITALDATGATNLVSVYPLAFGTTTPFVPGSPKVRIAAGAGAFTAALYLVKLEGITA